MACPLFSYDRRHARIACWLDGGDAVQSDRRHLGLWGLRYPRRLAALIAGVRDFEGSTSQEAQRGDHAVGHGLQIPGHATANPSFPVA